MIDTSIRDRVVQLGGNQANLEIALAIKDRWRWLSRLRTFDPEAGKVRVYPDYGYLKAYDEWLDDQGSGVSITLKSRRLIVSTHHTLRRLHRAWGCQENEAYKSLIISKGEREAFELIERLVFCLSTLPKHFQDYNPAAVTKAEIVFKRGGRILALPSTSDAGRTFGFTDAFCDEMAFWSSARQLWASIAPTTPRIDCVSTPNGEFNLFADFWNDMEQYPEFARTELWWYDHPDRDESWAKEQEKKLGSIIWKREHEHSFLSMAGRPVYEDFSPRVNVADEGIEIKPGFNVVVYRGLDFGFRHPACLWAWKNPKDQLCILREYAPENVDVRDFLARVVEISNAEYPGCSFKNFPDPAGRQKWQVQTEKGERTALEVMDSFGMGHYEFSHLGLHAGLDTVRELLKLRADGLPGLIIDGPKCPILVRAFAGGYHYPERRRGEIDVAQEDPFKDHWYDDVADALRYIATNVHSIKEPRSSRTTREELKKSYADPLAQFRGEILT